LEARHNFLRYVATANKHVSEEALFPVVNHVLPQGGATMEKTLAHQWLDTCRGADLDSADHPLVHRLSAPPQSAPLLPGQCP
jgi:hypothetical protein